MSYSRDELTTRNERCFKGFPYECVGCDYYKEKTFEPFWFMYLFFTPKISAMKIQECILYRKKVTEKLELR